MSRACLAALVAGLAACGSETTPLAALADVCGQPGALRVLDTGPALHLQRRPVRAGDRVVLLVGARSPAAADFTNLDDGAPAEAWATGPCGESPVRVAADVATVFSHERWPDQAFACAADDARDLLRLDLTGAAAPELLLAGGCLATTWTDHGLLVVEPRDGDLGALVLHPYPPALGGPGGAPEVLLEPIRVRPDRPPPPVEDGAEPPPPEPFPAWLQEVHRGFPGFALAVDADARLLRVDLADRSVTVEQPRVLAFAAGERWLVWQDAARTNDDPYVIEGQISLRDWQDGGDVILGHADLRRAAALTGLDPQFVTLVVGPRDGPTTRVFPLPRLDPVDLPRRRAMIADLEDGRFLLTGWRNRKYLFDTATREQALLFYEGGDLLWRDAGGVELLQVAACCEDSERRTEGALWYVPFDGGEPRPLAARATRLGYRLPDGRRVQAVSVGDDRLGALVLADPESYTERAIDDRVYAYEVHRGDAFGEDIVAYSVVDGARSGVYIARLPPAD
jgi:hypothetical protein